MSKLYYIEYGCSLESCSLIVEAKNSEDAYDYAYQSAQDSYDSYGLNDFDEDDYPDAATEDEMWEMRHDEMENDIHYLVEEYNENNEYHLMTFEEQKYKAFKIS